jgi:hypothetical protein
LVLPIIFDKKNHCFQNKPNHLLTTRNIIMSIVNCSWITKLEQSKL